METRKVIVSFNNGSVPPEYAYRYELIFSDHGSAELIVFKGYDLDEKNIFSETKKVNVLILEQLIVGINNLRTFGQNSPEVGGSQRSIEFINGKSEKIFIQNDNLEGIHLFNRFLYLYNPDFLNIINKIINH
ncbi:hypothetical protein [Chryseobacterium caseinilyticum]|uniref:Uncharacterized protein n=1 Tax=Chryseobacterium caseinilyticum TaxID=2771428 RepID=A0ABR8ZCA5_9FLAO|nr:hypothetical protein [Chryseobacterium caseinilyticum]MBD8082876.1 hypothetical protein [Chryseobacterium caseinilyticum]